MFFYTNGINTYMKNIKTFESYNPIDIPNDRPIKNYGEPFPLTDLSIGEEVIYMGSKFIVDSVDEYHVTLKSLENGPTLRPNQNMFNQRAYIGSK